VNSVSAKLKLAKLRVQENQALVKSGAGSRFDLEKAEADLAELSEQNLSLQYDLDQTIVRAPNDGIIVNVQLRPGAFVAAFPIASVMTFMEDTPQIYALFYQNELHQIEVGNEAEFYVPSFPGNILKAKVESIILAEGQGQLNASGTLPTTGLRDITPNRFAVKLVMDDRHAELLLPAGAVGDGAVYTDHLAFLHIIRKVMLRISTKLNYIIPKLHGERLVSGYVA
jgi:multidrug resistance efflux pump